MLYCPYVNSPSLKYETHGIASRHGARSPHSQDKGLDAFRCWSSMSALFNLSDLITVLLLLICICTYIRGYRKGIFDVEDGTHHGLRGVCWKASRVGERLSPYVSVALLLMAGHVLFFAN